MSKRSWIFVSFAFGTRHLLCACIWNIRHDALGFLLNVFFLLFGARKKGEYNTAYDCHGDEYYSNVAAAIGYECSELGEINHGLDE